jgi:hypothetical protein
MAVVLMGLIGLVTGISGPSRDLMMRRGRRPTPPAACSAWCIPGLDSGLAVGPLFGALMDAHHPAGVFVVIACSRRW